MSMNSLHQNNPNLNGGFFAAEMPHAEIVAAVLNTEYVFRRNYKNAGYTAFNEETVQIGYMKAKGRGKVAAIMIGYAGAEEYGIVAVKKRVRNMGPWKLRAMHESMKEHGLIPQTGQGNGATNGAGRHPLFHTFERLLQLFFEDYEAVEIPQRIRNWVPEEGTYWAHWWKER